MNLADFYKGKTVLITGHTGFKGAWLAQIMLNFGANVVGYSLGPNTTPNLFTALKLKDKINHNVGDIRDLKKFNEIVKKTKPDIIFHLAAQPIVLESYKEPVYTYETNVMGTVNVLEAIRLNGVRAGVIITTDKVYKNIEKDYAYAEDDSLGGYDPYSNSKACADLATSSYISSFFNPNEYGQNHNTLVGAVRAGNVIGGGDWASNRLVPDAMRAVFEDNEEVIIRSPKAIRPWQHVLEPLAGYIRLGAHLHEGEKDKSGSWNFGPEVSDMKEVETVLAMAFRHLNKGSYKVVENKSKHEAGILKLNNIKAKSQLGWLPKYNLNDAVAKTVDWYNECYNGKVNIVDYTDKEIQGYFKGEKL
jgi:CDP-glucose 4,6-dehydratase